MSCVLHYVLLFSDFVKITQQLQKVNERHYGTIGYMLYYSDAKNALKKA